MLRSHFPQGEGTEISLAYHMKDSRESWCWKTRFVHDYNCFKNIFELIAKAQVTVISSIQPFRQNVKKPRAA